MKKFLKVVLFCLFIGAVVAVPTLHVFAQDSTAVATDPSADFTDFFSFLIAFIPMKYQGITTTVLTGLFLLEQVLAHTKKVAANSTFQLVAGWLKSAYNAVKRK